MMTEPDLVSIGDDVSVDNASLIAHVNSRGDFSLNPLRVGAGCVLRSHSRLWGPLLAPLPAAPPPAQLCADLAPSPPGEDTR